MAQTESRAPLGAHRWLARLAEPFRADLRSIALSRIAVGSVLLADTLLRLRDLGAFYGDSGLLPRRALFELGVNKWKLSLFAVSGHEPVLFALFILLAVAAIAIILGYRTRPATVIAWLLVISLHNRNPMILTGADTVMRVSLFWGMFAPWAAHWSLDRVLKPDAGLLRPRLSSGFQILTWGSAALLLQPILVHLFAGLLKTAVDWRGFGHMSLQLQPESFSALYFVLEADQFNLPVGQLVRQLPFGALQVLTAITMVFELFAPLALLVTAWKGRVRLMAWLALCSIHVGLMFVMQLGIFPWINLATLVVFMPAIAWDQLDSLQVRLDRFFRRLGGWMPSRAATRVRRTTTWTLGQQEPAALKFTIALAMLLVIGWNLDSLPRSFIPQPLHRLAGQYDVRLRLIPMSARPVVYVLRLDQRWNLFAPRPMRDDGWYVIPGELKNGAEVDIYRDGSEVSWEKPEHIAGEFPNYRWRKYSRNLWRKHNKKHRLWYGKWLCRTWNAAHDGGDTLMRFDIYFMKETSVLPGQPVDVDKVDLWHHECFVNKK